MAAGGIAMAGAGLAGLKLACTIAVSIIPASAVFEPMIESLMCP